MQNWSQSLSGGGIAPAIATNNITIAIAFIVVDNLKHLSLYKKKYLFSKIN